ncbi:MAG: response regulator [Chitinophagaceae bacterium]|nr:MAG: response regulator [Chitinophagaceae bacterium]
MTKKILNILLADDDSADRLLFKEAFNELKIETKVETVFDGVELMNYLLNDANTLPDLLFLDLNMPRKNGLECLKEIRNNEKIKDISIAIYSTSSSEKDIEETFLNGANVYVNKPNDYFELLKVLEKAVKVAYLFQDKSFKKENFLLRV